MTIIESSGVVVLQRSELEAIIAATWLAPRMDIMDLCKMFGWTDPRQAMTYYNPTASQIAARIKK